MNERFSWMPTEVRSYRALYKGRRYWVFENDFQRPYGIYDDAKYHQILLFDATVGEVIAAGTRMADGSIMGCVMWGQGVDFHAANAADMVHQTLGIAKWYC
jgi:hypothetical protein